jgi:hypothetical protein
MPGFSNATYDAAINRAYDFLGRSHPWVNLEKEFKFATVQYVDTGGVDFNSGSTSITAATSVSAAWSNGESNGYAGMFIKKDDEAAYYTITSSTSVLITITENYIGKSTTAVASAGDGYVIFKHLYAIDSTIMTVNRLMHDTYLDEMDTLEFEIRDPDLDAEGEPGKWRQVGTNSSNVSVVQLYPPRIDDVYEIRGRGIMKTETLTSSTTPLIDSVLIIAFAQVELLQRKRILSPNVISSEMIVEAKENAGRLVEGAIEHDTRRRTISKYVQDRFFGGHKGHQWYVEHDPADRY